MNQSMTCVMWLSHQINSIEFFMKYILTLYLFDTCREGDRNMATGREVWLNTIPDVFPQNCNYINHLRAHTSFYHMHRWRADASYWSPSNANQFTRSETSFPLGTRWRQGWTQRWRHGLGRQPSRSKPCSPRMARQSATRPLGSGLVL